MKTAEEKEKNETNRERKRKCVFDTSRCRTMSPSRLGRLQFRAVHEKTKSVIDYLMKGVSTAITLHVRFTTLYIYQKRERDTTRVGGDEGLYSCSYSSDGAGDEGL